MTDDRPVLMLVDDEPDILVALLDLFESRYAVATFTRPEEALQALERGVDPTVILSDQRMPGMTGDVFLTEARRFSDAGAILLTGYADLGAVTAALNRGGIVGYAAKPWEPEALLAMVAGVAERHRLRRALEGEQALLRGLMEHLPYAVSFKDAAGRFIHLNNAKASVFDRPIRDCIGRTVAELDGEADPVEQQAMAADRPLQVVREDSGASGARWTQVDYIPLRDRNGQCEALVVMERDITGQRLAEQHLRQSEKLRALGTLAGGVAHDFNNLLTAILGSLELARRKVGDPNALQRQLDNATLAAHRGAALTRRLLGFSRQTEASPIVIDLSQALEQMRDLLARTLGGVSRVTWLVPADLWPTSAEPDQLEVAVLNLAVNARDAMPDGGEIRIEARNVTVAAGEGPAELEPGDYVVVTVADQGEGMAAGVLERVLEPFFTTKPVGQGTGLGLPMVYGFAQRSGGGLHIDSAPGQGCRVSLFLPRAAPASGQDSPIADAADPGRGAAAARILVVDDEDGVRSVTAAVLRELGHEVLEAADGPQALALLADDVDLVVVDFAMPGMNGTEFVEAARDLQPGLPAILLTGFFDLETAPAAVRVIQKPFSQADLSAAVSSALASGERDPSGSTAGADHAGKRRRKIIA